MPRMDGIDFLVCSMRSSSMPVVMVSSLTGKGSEITPRALELGAVGSCHQAAARHPRGSGRCLQRDDCREDPHCVPGEACGAQTAVGTGNA